MKIYGKIEKLVRSIFERQGSAPTIDTDTSAIYMDTNGYPKVLRDAATVETDHSMLLTTETSVTANTVPRYDSTTGKIIKKTAVVIDDTNNITGVTSITVGNTGLTVGASAPFSDAAGTLTLQNVDALDATTEATVETAIDTLANLTSIQSQSVSLSGALTVEAGGAVLNQDLTTDASPTFASLKLTETGGGADLLTIQSPAITGAQTITMPAATGTLATLAGSEALTTKTYNGLSVTTGSNTFTLTKDSSTLIRAGAHSLTLTSTGATDVTLPTTGTLATLAGTETLTNKKLTGGAASTDREWTVPSKSDQVGLSATVGNLMFDTTTDKATVYTAAGWKAIGGGLVTEVKSASFNAAVGKHYLVNMTGAGADFTATLPAGAAEAVIWFSVFNNSAHAYRLVLDGSGSETLTYESVADTTARVLGSDTWVQISWDTVGSTWRIDDPSVFVTGTFSGALTVTGALTPSGGIKGLATGAAGGYGVSYVGESKEASVVTTTTGNANNWSTASNTLPLTKGRWDISYHGTLTGVFVSQTGVIASRVYNSTAGAEIAGARAAILPSLTAAGSQTHNVSNRVVVDLAADSDIILQVASSVNAAAYYGGFALALTGGITGNESDGKIIAIRIA